MKIINIMGNKTERQWEIESALGTLQRAAEIRKDTKLMRDVNKAALTEINKLKSLTSSSTSKKTLPRKKTLKRK